MSLELTETYSLAKIKEALSSPALDRDTARNVINLYRRVKDSPNNEILVTYEKKKGHGRYYPTSGHHQACYQWKHLRATLSEGETDIDAVNCSPTIFTALCRQLGIDVKYLPKYLDNRQQFIDDLFKDYLLVTEKLAGSTFSFERHGDQIRFFKGSNKKT